jgi:hypothetical protein
VKKAKFSKELQPYACDDLIRLGQDFDGGYLVSKRDVESSDGLIGLGVYKDWSFEREFRALNKVRVDTYDRSVGVGFFIRNIIRKILRIYNLPKFIDAVANLVSYFLFFGQKGVSHYRKFIGMNIPPNIITLGEAMSIIEGDNTFLKIDIEGSEYRILDDLLACADQTSGLAIEFHDCDLHMERILRFVEAYPLALVHLHVNTGSHVSPDGIPLAIELTFSSAEKGGDATASLPHRLDMPNKKGASEFEVHFAS